MKTFAETVKRIIFATMLLLATASCTHDDIGEIFIDREWTLSLVKEGAIKRYSNKKYNVLFTDENFNVTTPGGAGIKGEWAADNKNRTFHCWNIKTTGSLKGDTIAEKMLQIFTNATSYDGDTNWLQIKEQKNVYMQFYSK